MAHSLFMNPDIPEFAKPKQIAHWFPLSHSQVYVLMNEGLIKSHLLKLKGNRKGMRLVSTASVRKYIESCPAK